ncbi:MAG TPA: hypothetical protein VHL50_01790 [Pyrinomonadaceae bacterium]|nr:hypothetical protein [Pyrinomonadaceae bacterium]
MQKYDISATLPTSPADRNLTAKAKVDVTNVSGRPASTLTLRISQNAEVSAVAINGATADFTKGEEKIANGSLQRIVVRIPTVQPGGTVSATVDYKLNVKDNSGLSAISPVGAQFLPLSFWYPTPNSWYFARGADYAPFRIQVNAPGQTIVSAGGETSGVFEQKFGGQPFFAAGNWDAVNSGGVSVYLQKGSGAEEQKRAAELAAIAADAKTFAAGLLGTAPDSSIRLVAVKRGGGFTSGGTVFIDDSVFRRSKIDSLTAVTVADAVAKIWLGNAASISGDGSGVVREGLTKFIATEFLENKFGKDIADVERLRQRVAYAAVSKRDSPLNTVTSLDDYYYPEVANKGAMVWRLLAKRVGRDQFFAGVRAAMQDGQISLGELRDAFSTEKELLDKMFDQVTDTNLLAGLPQPAGGETRVALRNTGSLDATVDVEALMANGERVSAPTTIRAKSFGEVAFRTPNKITRVEVDAEKMYPQTDYSDDVAPREFSDSDLLLAVKRSFDKQEFAPAEQSARTILKELPRFDDVRVLLARSLLAQNKNAEAEKEFRAVLDEKLPTARSLAWANVGLADISSKNGQAAQAAKYAEEAIRADAEYGASLAARTIRNRANASTPVDDTVKNFFANFDKAAVSNRKADLEAMVVPGEVSRFASGISGQTVEWKTQVVHTDQVDANTVLAETALNIKLLNRDPESGTAVFRLVKSGGGWKLANVDIFEVR